MTRRATVKPVGSRAEVYDGRDCAGSVEPFHGGFLARCTRGRALGTYTTRKEAMATVLRVARERRAETASATPHN